MKLVTLKDNRLARVEGRDIFPFEYDGGMVALIEDGQAGLDTMRARTANVETERFDLTKITAPIRPSKIIAIGKNYAEHAKETKSSVPKNPIVFTKFTTSIIGYGEEVTWSSRLTKEVDYEAELAVVIGRTARHVSRSYALSYVFGYTCANDISARDLQASDGQWVRAKSLDTFCPLGPYIVTTDEVPNPQQLTIICRINNREMQDGHTSQMIFGVAELISFLSEAFTLLPGDVILTGTPEGVGKFRTPPVFLQDGDTVTVSIDCLGQLDNPCRVI